MGKRRWRDYRCGKYRLRFFQGEGCAVWYEGGKRRRYRLGAVEEIQARAALDAFARRRDQLTRTGRETVADLWSMYFADREKDGKQMDNFRYSWLALEPRFGKVPPSVVDSDMCRAYARERIEAGKSAGTIWTELLRLRSCLNWASKNHKTDAKWVVWVPSKPKVNKRVLTTDEAHRLLDACSTPHIKLFVIVALSTGGREAAICELRWSQVNFAESWIDLKTGLAGNPLQKVVRKGRARVHMNDWCRAALSEAKEGAETDYVIEYGGKPIARPGAAFNKAAARAGLADVTPHTLRHTALSWMEEDGVPFQVISRFASHAQESTTRNIYSKPQASVTKPAADVIELRMNKRGTAK